MAINKFGHAEARCYAQRLSAQSTPCNDAELRRHAIYLLCSVQPRSISNNARHEWNTQCARITLAISIRIVETVHAVSVIILGVSQVIMRSECFMSLPRLVHRSDLALVFRVGYCFRCGGLTGRRVWIVAGFFVVRGWGTGCPFSLAPR